MSGIYRPRHPERTVLSGNFHPHLHLLVTEELEDARKSLAGLS